MKLRKNALQIPLCENMSGSKTFPVILIEKSGNPRFTVGLIILSATYENNRKVCTTSGDIANWFKNIEKK